MITAEKSRESKCLNGLWEFAPGDGKLGSIPDCWETTRIEVPSPWNINSFAAPFEGETLKKKYFLRGGEYNLFPQYPKEWESAKSGWYKTEFIIPEEWKGKKITLKFNAVHFHSEFYINEKKIAEDTDGFLPFEFDIENAVRYGEPNTLAVGVEKLDLFTVKLKDEVEKEKFEHPTGSFWGCHIAGIWQDVFLNCYPTKKIEDVSIQTDVQKHILSARVELSGCDKSMSLEYSLRKKDSNESIVLGRQIVEAGVKNVFFLYDYTGLKEKIKLWWPHDPQLYMLAVCLKNKQENDEQEINIQEDNRQKNNWQENKGHAVNGQDVVDIVEIRFGFRSFGISGNKFILNGIPVNLRNDSWHYMGFAYQKEEYARLWYKMAKDANVNCIRLHAQVYPEFFLDIADEMGMMIIDESSLWASHCRMHYSDRLIENTKKHLERLVKRDRNHPSVIIWSIENECIPAYRVHGDSAVANEEELNKKLYQLAWHVKKLDPGRPASADGSFDLGGRMDVLSLHYPSREKSVETDKPVTIGEMGSMYYSTPDCVCNITGGETYLSFDRRLEALGMEAFDLLKEQRKWAAQVCIFNLVWYGLYPLPIREKMLHYADHSLPGIKPARIGPYISTLNADYDDSLPEYIPNPVFKWVQKAYIPERFFFEDDKTRYYSGTDAIKKISVFNDSLEEKKYIISWQLSMEGNALDQGMVSVQMPPAQYRVEEIHFRLPELEKTGQCRFEIEMLQECCPDEEKNSCYKYEEKNRWCAGKVLNNAGCSVKDLLNDRISGIETRQANREVFRDYQILKVYNQISLIKDNNLWHNVAFVSNDKYAQNLFRGTGVHFYSTDTLKGHMFEPSHLLYILSEKIGAELYDELISRGKKIIDISCQSEQFKKWSWQNPVEKIFLNININTLTEGLEEADLCHWRNGLVSDFSLSDFINANSGNLFVNGKGTPVITELEFKSTSVIISAVDFLKLLKEEPASLLLLVNLIRYSISKEGGQKCRSVLIADENSTLIPLFKSMDIFFNYISRREKERIKALKYQPLIIADGNGDLEFLDELTSENTERLVLFGLDRDKIPGSLKGFLDIEYKPLTQLVKEAAIFTEAYAAKSASTIEPDTVPVAVQAKASCDSAIEGMHPGDLYGLEAGNETLLTEYPVHIYDEDRVTGLLKNPDIDWTLWNMQGEDRKTAAVERNKYEIKQKVYGLVKTQVNGIEVYINQINTSSTNNKLKKFLCTLLGNLGAQIEVRDIDEFDAILNEGVYEQEVKRFLRLGPIQEYSLEPDQYCGSGSDADSTHAERTKVFDPELAQPALNKQEGGLYWKLADSDEKTSKGKFIYGLYVFSPSDRTDLLLNPDLIGIELDTGSESKLYLNGISIACGSHIEVNALKLRAGWNLLILCLNRDNEKHENLHMRFKRKDNRPLDLGFSLNAPGMRPIPGDKWTFDSNFHKEECKKAIQGKGILWDSVDFQFRGMYFSIDMGEAHSVFGLHFNSKILKSDHIQWNTPRSFSIQSSDNGKEWRTVCFIKNESDLTLVDGKLILNFNPFKARYIKLNLEDVANKRFMISELVLYTNDR